MPFRQPGLGLGFECYFACLRLFIFRCLCLGLFGMLLLGYILLARIKSREFKRAAEVARLGTSPPNSGKRI